MPSMFDFLKKEEVGQVIGLDIGTASVKVVQLRREKEKIILDTYGEVALGPYGGMKIGQGVRLGEEKLAEAVSDLFKEAKVKIHAVILGDDLYAEYPMEKFKMNAEKKFREQEVWLGVFTDEEEAYDWIRTR